MHCFYSSHLYQSPRLFYRHIIIIRKFCSYILICVIIVLSLLSLSKPRIRFNICSFEKTCPLFLARNSQFVLCFHKRKFYHPSTVSFETSECELSLKPIRTEYSCALFTRCALILARKFHYSEVEKSASSALRKSVYQTVSSFAVRNKIGQS